MTVTEITVLKLQNANTFNPMVILQLLQQMVTTYGHVAGFTFKAYQEKEVYSRFYVIGGWTSIEAQEAFVKSETHQKVLQLIESTLMIEARELIEMDAASLTAMSGPIVVMERWTLKNKQVFADLLTAGQNAPAGFITGADTYIVFSSMKTVPKIDQVAESLDETMKKLTLHVETRHLEINQFI